MTIHSLSLKNGTLLDKEDKPDESLLGSSGSHTLGQSSREFPTSFFYYKCIGFSPRGNSFSPCTSDLIPAVFMLFGKPNKKQKVYKGVRFG